MKWVVAAVLFATICAHAQEPLTLKATSMTVDISPNLAGENAEVSFFGPDFTAGMTAGTPMFSPFDCYSAGSTAEIASDIYPENGMFTFRSATYYVSTFGPPPGAGSFSLGLRITSHVHFPERIPAASWTVTVPARIIGPEGGPVLGTLSNPDGTEVSLRLLVHPGRVTYNFETGWQGFDYCFREATFVSDAPPNRK